MKQNLEDKIACFENWGHWVKKNVGIYLTVLAIGATGVGCAPTTRILKSGDVWYECFMDRNYPAGHPCYAEVQKYLAENSPSSPSSPSDNSSSNRENGRDYFSPGEKGHKVCKEKH